MACQEALSFDNCCVVLMIKAEGGLCHWATSALGGEARILELVWLVESLSSQNANIGEHFRHWDGIIVLALVCDSVCYHGPCFVSWRSSRGTWPVLGAQQIGIAKWAY